MELVLLEFWVRDICSRFGFSVSRNSSKLKLLQFKIKPYLINRIFSQLIKWPSRVTRNQMGIRLRL